MNSKEKTGDEAKQVSKIFNLEPVAGLNPVLCIMGIQVRLTNLGMVHLEHDEIYLEASNMDYELRRQESNDREHSSQKDAWIFKT